MKNNEMGGGMILKRVQAMWDIFYTALVLGLTSFGGPTAHFGYFYRTYVVKKQWVDPDTYADLIALANFLPGPASSQVGMSIGLLRGGFIGGLLAWLGFTLPSALIMAFFAWSLSNLSLELTQDTFWLKGLKLLAVAIVLQAVYSMAQKLSTGRLRATITIITAIVVLLSDVPGMHVGLIIAGGLITWLGERKDRREEGPLLSDRATPAEFQRQMGWILLGIFMVIFFFAWMAQSDGWQGVRRDVPMYPLLFSKFFLTGSFVFGGGHVVLPLLEKDVVPTGWVSADQFLAGYGLAQGLPGPLFTFAVYLGTLIAGWPGAFVGLVAIFLPGMLLMAGVYPFWQLLKSHRFFQKIMSGVGAAVVGLLLAALYDPLWTGTVNSAYDASIVGILWMMLHVWQRPPLMVLIISIGLSWIKMHVIN